MKNSIRAIRTRCLKQYKRILRLLYKTTMSDHRNSPQCSICWEVITQQKHQLEGCDHQYHVNCIMNWFRSSETGECPMCRGGPPHRMCFLEREQRANIIKQMARRKNAPPLLKRTYQQYKDCCSQEAEASKELNQYVKKTHIRQILNKRRRLSSKRWQARRSKRRMLVRLCNIPTNPIVRIAPIED